VFFTVNPFHVNLIFSVETRAYQSGVPFGALARGAFNLPTNIRLEHKWLRMKNILAYYRMYFYYRRNIYSPRAKVEFSFFYLP